MDKKIIKQTARAYYNLLPFMRKTENAFAKFEAIFGNGAVSYINNVWHEASKEQPNTEKPYLAVVELPGKSRYMPFGKATPITHFGLNGRISRT